MKRRSRDYVRADHWTRQLKRGLQFGWLAICLMALAAWWFGGGFTDGAGHRVEHRQLLDAIMAVIAFPAGLIWMWVAPSLEPLAQSIAYSAGLTSKHWHSFGPELFSWFGASLIGYIQWFWLLPTVFSLRSGE